MVGLPDRRTCLQVGYGGGVGGNGRDLGPSVSNEQAEELSRVVSRVVRARVRDRDLADDLVQETLALVLARQSDLDPDAVRPYAIVTAQNVVASARRADGRSARNAHRLIDLRTAGLPEEEVLHRDERRSMSEAMGQLSEKDRNILVSHEVLDISTKELAEGHGTTPGAIAVRLAAARAKLRLEYVLSLRREPALPPRCRSVLVALSANDRRRQVALGAREHLSSCERCAGLSEPLLGRSRASAALLPLLAAREVLTGAGASARRHPTRTAMASVVAAVAAVALVGQAVGGDGERPSRAPVSAAAPEAAPDPGPVSVDGRPLGDLSVERRAALVGRPVSVRAAVVSDVPADEGFWLDDGAGARVWVQLTTGSESSIAIAPGMRVSFEGRLAETTRDFAGRAGVAADEGAGELLEGRVHIEVPADAVVAA